MKWPKEKGETMIWNNFNKVRSKSKDWKPSKKDKVHKQDSQNRIRLHWPLREENLTSPTPGNKQTTIYMINQLLILIVIY
jgi:hypothetical protein